MPRIHNPTTLRSRNRVTNKTRLKIKHGDIDFDPDDSPIQISNDTAGVDAEDANVSIHYPCLFPSLSSLSHPLLDAASWRPLIGCWRGNLNPWIAD
jgi:enhancer of polycomb-like protein